MSLAPGTLLGDDFKLLHPLFQGGIGSIYFAQQLSTGRPCAVKALLPEDDAARRLALREPRILLRIPSDHVPQVLRIGVNEPEKPIWFAMDYIPGASLASSIMTNPERTLHEARDILSQICRGLEAAHRRGIIHCNLTPDNVLIARVNHVLPFVKLVGFKYAKSTSVSDVFEHQSAGTLNWMAPEQLRSRDLVSPATDIWAFGLIAFTILTGSSYWDFYEVERRRTLHGLAPLLTDEPFPSASSCAARLGAGGRIPDGFDAWFSRCVARDPNDRFPTATEAWLALSGLLPEAPDRWLPRGLPVSFVDDDDSELRSRSWTRSRTRSAGLEGRGSELLSHSLTTSPQERSVPTESPRGPAAAPSGIQVFISYSQKDDHLCDELLLHLAMMRRQGLVREWYDRRVDPGVDRLSTIEAELERSEAVVLLVSADFIASDTCYDVEMRRACEKHDVGEGVVIPVIVRMCEWSYAPFARFSALPTNGKAVTSWPNRDEAWFDVTCGIRTTIVEFMAELRPACPEQRVVS
jgi:serine/threonine protein kinase